MSGLAFDRAGSGPPLVLLHPLGADRRVWRPVLPLLEPQRDVIAVDLPGFGDSPPLASASPADLARGLIGLLDELGLRAPHVAGNSLGGWVALETALAGRAASVTAIAPAGLWARPLAPKPELARTLARLARPALGAAMKSAAVRRAVLAGSVARPGNVPPADAAALVRAYATAPGFTAANCAMRAGTFTRLAEICVPVTLAWPEYDRLVARPERLPAHVVQVALRDCGHIPMWDAPRAVAAVLLAGSESAVGYRGGSGTKPEVRRT